MKSCTPTSTENSNLEEVLRARGVKLEKSRKIIDRLISKCGHIVKNNPQRKYHPNKPSMDSLQHYSQSQYSAESDDEKEKVPPRALPRIDSKTQQKNGKQNQLVIPMSPNDILVQRAKKFVSRLRKQKQYEEGKALMRRRNQQKKKQLKLKAQREQRQRQRAQFLSQKHSQMVQNILYHEQRIGFRLNKSIGPYRKSVTRHKTQGNDEFERKRKVTKSAMFQYDDSSSSRLGKSRVELPIVATLRKRVALLSSMIDSLQQ